jgi:ribokinase
LENADIIYISDDTIEGDPYEFIDDFARRYDPEIIILGQGKTGLILYDRDRHVKIHYNSVKTNEVVNSLGAGNALISGFIHYYLETKDSVNAIKNGLLYASYKTGFMRTCEGFLTPEQVEQWRDLIWKTQSVTDMYGVEVPEN